MVFLISWCIKSLDFPDYTRSQSIVVPSLTVKMSSLQGWTLASPSMVDLSKQNKWKMSRCFLEFSKFFSSSLYWSNILYRCCCYIFLSGIEHRDLPLHGGAPVEYQIIDSGFLSTVLIIVFLPLYLCIPSHTVSQEC